MDIWTIKQLKEISDLDFAICILNERKNALTNPYSPFSDKIGKAVGTLEKIKGIEKVVENTLSEITFGHDNLNLKRTVEDRLKESLKNVFGRVLC